MPLPEESAGVLDALASLTVDDATWKAVAAARASFGAAAEEWLTRRHDAWREPGAAIRRWVEDAAAVRAEADELTQLTKARSELAKVTRRDADRAIPRGRRAVGAHLAVAATGEQRRAGRDQARRAPAPGGTSRFRVAVDGTRTPALAVMSQGELHALGLALFLPAPAAGEPLPVRGNRRPGAEMDPAKVDGLARVLPTWRRTRQVVVFTHDDRLRRRRAQLGIDAAVLRVDRGPGSAVVVRPQSDAVTRMLEEARVLAGDPDVPVDVARLVSPNLCRQALETALARSYRRARHGRRRARRGRRRAPQTPRASTSSPPSASSSDATKHGQVLGRLNNRWGPGASDTFKALNQAGHIGLHGNDQVIDLVDAARKLIGQVAA